jgi:hypothetical protein
VFANGCRRRIKGEDGTEILMYPLWSIGGGFLATLGIIGLAASGPTSLAFVSSALTAQPNGTAASVDRTNKGDRLAAPRTNERSRVSVVEVVGVSDTAIVYRDRDGRVLFRTDPVANVTLIAKDVELPEVTVRESNTKVPVQMPVKTLQESESKRPLDGCDPLVSPLAGSNLSRVPGRCIAALGGRERLAMAQ